ncbi:DUF2304 domain-containing protein [Microbacterium sp. JZ31]|uniref:DUF2304 domain-containing protein n=1 Tax=Microbacterium sp. JZ31 TaxID=1906274 RepID=UPI001EE4849F|nr:DUF2304 domain-containing protein [Microbacterium sp. JZ31]
MISSTTYVFGILAAVAVLVVIFILLRRGTLRERHAVWWIVAGVLALVIAIVPQLLVWAADLLGVEVPTNLVFFVAIALLVLLSLQHSAELTRAEDRIRTLAEHVAAQDLRLSELEKQSSADHQPREQHDGR